MRPDIKESLDRYASVGVPPGGFLRAVLENDLTESFARADIQNRCDMFEIVSYVYNELPAMCQGSPQKVAAWIEAKAQEREKTQEAKP